MRISDLSSDVCSSDLAIREEKFDGLIVTGAPIEQLPFEEVVYWDELRGIFDWSQTHVHGLFALCWGAQAALYHFHGIPKHQLPEKRFGVFTHRVLAHSSLLMRGLADELDRKSVVQGKSVSVRVDIGGPRIIK